MTSGSRWRSVLAAGAVLIAACSSGPSEVKTVIDDGGSGSASADTTAPESAGGSDTSDGASTTTGEAAGSDEGFELANLDWQPCDVGDCADLDVPLDHDDPGGPTISVAMSRLPASGTPEQRIGSIFVNFGGPGGEGTEALGSFAGFIPDELRQQFDIVSWDPRGVESTAGLGCDDLIGDEPTELVDADDGFDDDVAADREVWDRVMACVARSPIVNDLGTTSVAKDLDLMRRAVGDDQLTYLGFSYGTQIGWVYATLFPRNVRAMVLDGAAPPYSGLVEATTTQAVSIEAAIDRYDQGCAQAPTCAISDEGFRATILRLMRELEASPIPLDDGTTFGPVDLGNLTITMTYFDPEDWGPTFTDTVAALDGGDVSGVQALASALEGGFEEAAFWAVLCADGDGVIESGAPAELYEQVLDDAPLLGLLPGGIFCDSFPGEIDGLPELDTTGTPPLLVIGNTGDNATPYEDAVRLDGLLADSTLLTYDGPGHTITFFDACVDGFVVDYFIDLAVPPPGARCGNPSTVADGWFVPITD